jgi:hypothetical protein
MNDLAVSAAQALVQSMTTSAWDEVRSRISVIFSRRKSGRRIRNELDVTRSNLIADSSNRDKEIARWVSIFRGLMSSYPGAATDLGITYEYLTRVVNCPEEIKVSQTGYARRDQYNVQGDLIINHR